MALSVCTYVHSALKHTYLKDANAGLNAASLFSLLKNAERFAPGAFVNSLNKKRETPLSSLSSK